MKFWKVALSGRKRRRGEGMAIELELIYPEHVLVNLWRHCTSHQVKWCLLCYGIKAPTSWKGTVDCQVGKIVWSWLIAIYNYFALCKGFRKHEKVVDVDGSYMHRKYQSLLQSLCNQLCCRYSSWYCTRVSSYQFSTARLFDSTKAGWLEDNWYKGTKDDPVKEVLVKDMGALPPLTRWESVTADNHAEFA